jgi:hypothetical protein
MSTYVNQSELVALFTDYDQPTAPYDGLAMRLTLTADLAVLAIGRYVQGDAGKVGTETFTFDDKQSIGVDAEQLYQTLGAMLRRADRHAFDRLKEGTLPADHPSLRAQPVAVNVPATRVRA